MQQRRLLTERHRMLGRQHTDRRTDPDPAGAAQQQRGKRHRIRADAVRYEVVFRQPDIGQSGFLRHLGGAHRAVQCFPLSLTGELSGQDESPNAHRSLPPSQPTRPPPYRQQRPTRAKGTA